ncbi:MAG: ABC transporter substrate-binding protein [Gemmatimonadota bacterium]|jgi:peptide/nickel transport system substrate-binding protein
MTKPHRSRAAPLLLTLFLAAACGDGGERTPRAEAMAGGPFCEAAMTRVNEYMAAATAETPVPEDPAYGGAAVVGGITDLIRGMNALQTVDINASQYQQFVNLMTLIQVDRELEPTPYLAESWTVSEDGTSLTFRLRDDVYWHDGERTDAYDVAFTYLRATDPETAFPNAAFFRWYVPGEAGVEVEDSLTVTFRMEPHSEVLDPWRALAIMPRHLLEDVPPSELASHPFGTVCPVGNGPFVFLAHRPDESWIFEANPAFPAELGGRPFLDRLVYRVVPEQTTLLTELLTGSVDVYVDMRPDQAAVVMESDDADVLTMDARSYTFVAWNSRRAELADPRVRQALTLAIDRSAVVDALLRGYGTLARTGIPPYHWAYDPEMDGLDYDPARARTLLTEAGWTDRDGDGVRENADGLPLELVLIFNAANQDRRTIAELMQAQLREVGVELTPEPLEAGTMAARATDPERRDFDGLILEWFPEFRVDETDLFAGSRVDSDYAFAGLQDREIDRLLDRLQVELDRGVARPLWERYQRRIVELQPFTYFYYAQRLAGVSRRLRGVEMDFRGEWSSVRDWRIDPAER